MSFPRHLAIVPVLFVTLLALDSVSRAEEAADAFDCPDCHPTKIRDFKGRRANPIVAVEEFPELPSGKQDIASSEAMCFSCHDGFVMDSREAWADGRNHGHRVGMIPSDDMVLPMLDGTPEFPMNDDGRMYCGTCHSAHLNNSEGAFGQTKPFMRQSAEGGQICTACHTGELRIKDSAHDKGSRRAKDFEKRGLCENCHAPHGSDRPVMWAGGLGDAELPADQLCRSCHDDAPVPGEHPANVVAWSQDIRSSIFPDTLAAMPVFDADVRQQPIGNIGCSTCHNVHEETSAGRPAHLDGLHLRMPEFVGPLCADCHGSESLFLYKFFHSKVSRR